MIFTVFTPTHDRAHTLVRVFSSLKAQTFRSFEWVIVDDGSTDKTETLVRSWISAVDFSISYHRQPQGGKHRATNRGVALAKGALFLTLDSDDACVPTALERLYHHWSQIPADDRAGTIFSRHIPLSGSTRKHRGGSISEGHSRFQLHRAPVSLSSFGGVVGVSAYRNHASLSLSRRHRDLIPAGKSDLEPDRSHIQDSICERGFENLLSRRAVDGAPGQSFRKCSRGSTPTSHDPEHRAGLVPSCTPGVPQVGDSPCAVFLSPRHWFAAADRRVEGDGRETTVVVCRAGWIGRVWEGSAQGLSISM